MWHYSLDLYLQVPHPIKLSIVIEPLNSALSRWERNILRRAPRISCRERLPVEDSLGERLPSIQRGGKRKTTSESEAPTGEVVEVTEDPAKGKLENCDQRRILPPPIDSGSRSTSMSSYPTGSWMASAATTHTGNGITNWVTVPPRKKKRVSCRTPSTTNKITPMSSTATTAAAAKPMDGRMGAKLSALKKEETKKTVRINVNLKMDCKDQTFFNHYNW